MKQYITLFLFLTFTSFSHSEQIENPLTDGYHSSSQISELGSFANHNGTYTLYLYQVAPNNNWLLFDRRTYNGWTSAGYTYFMEDSVLSSPVITGSEDAVWIMFAASGKFHLTQSTDTGTTWTSLTPFNFPMGDTIIYGIDMQYVPGTTPCLYVTYSTGTSANTEVYFRRYNLNTNTWQQIATVTDESGMYGHSPSIFVSSQKIHLSFTKSSSIYAGGQTKVRERLINSASWDPSYDISALPNNGSGVSSIIVDGSYLHALVLGFAIGANYPLYHIKKNLSTGDTTKIKLSDSGYTIPPKLLKTASGIFHAFYIGLVPSGNTFFEHQQYGGSNWNIIGNRWYAPGTTSYFKDFSACVVGNDMYVYKEFFYNNDWWFDIETTRLWFNGAPVAPSNLAYTVVSSHPKLTWSFNPEPDIKQYDIYRDMGSGYSKIASVSSPTTTYTDNDIVIGSSNPYSAWYYAKGVDYSNLNSSPSNTIRVRYYGVQDKPVQFQQMPTDYSIGPNYPNPFNPTTSINYSIPEPSDVSIIIYNQLGKEVGTLLNKFHTPGFYSVSFDASNLSSGVYFYTINAGKFRATKKMLLMK